MSSDRPHLWIRFTAFLLVTAAVAGGGWWFVKQQENKGGNAKVGNVKGAAAVTTVKVNKENYATDLSAIGTVQADESAVISPNVTETVMALHFDDGQRVKKGDLLATLSDAEEQALLASAQSSLKEDEREISRLTSLVKDGAAPEARLQERQTMAEVSRQRIREAEAKVADRRITAPFDGVLGLRRISVGALVSPATVIVTLDKTDVVKVDFTVPETALNTLQMGMKIAGVAEAARGTRFEGKLSQLDSRVDPVTRSVAARAIIPNESGALKPGMLIMVQVAMEPRHSLSIPERALVPIGSRSYVFAVVEGKAKKVEVQTGRRKPGFVEILSGLTEGQVLIADGLVGLQDGNAVKVTGEFKAPVKAFNPEQNREATP